MNRLALILTFGFSLIISAQSSKSIDELHSDFEKYIFTSFEKAHETAKELVGSIHAKTPDYLKILAYDDLSKIYYFKKENDSAHKYLDLGLRIAERTKDYSAIARLFNRKGSLAKRNGNYSAALKLYERAFNTAEEHKIPEIISHVNSNRAWLYHLRNDSINAKKEIQKAIRSAETENLQESLIRSYNIKGIINFRTQKDTAIVYYSKAVKLANELGNNYMEGVALSNLADIYVSTEDYSKALPYIKESERLSKSVGDFSTLYYMLLTLGSYYENMGDVNKAITNYNTAINNYGKYIDKGMMLNAYWMLSGALEHTGDYKEAFKIQEKYIALKDSVFNVEKAKEFDAIRTQFEVEKKDSQIALLEAEKRAEATRKKWIIISSILLLIPLTVLAFFYRHRIKVQKIIRDKEHKLHKQETLNLQKEQELSQIKAQIEGQDKERTRISKELHDGLASQLASVNLTLSHVNTSLKNPKITSISEKLSMIFKELRIVSHNLSANYFNTKGFKMLLAELKQQYEHISDFKVTISVYPEDGLKSIESNIKHNVFRILQELFNNVVKHANCKNVVLSIHNHGNSLVVIFEDDGVGFDLEKVEKGIGIANINERIRSINGIISLDSQLGKGTQITMEIPLLK